MSKLMNGRLGTVSGVGLLSYFPGAQKPLMPPPSSYFVFRLWAFRPRHLRRAYGTKSLDRILSEYLRERAYSRRAIDKERRRVACCLRPHRVQEALSDGLFCRARDDDSERRVRPASRVEHASTWTSFPASKRTKRGFEV